MSWRAWLLGGCLAGFLTTTVMVVTGTGIVAVDRQVTRAVGGGVCCTPTQVFWDRLTAVISPEVDAVLLAGTGLAVTVWRRRPEPVLAAGWALAVGLLGVLTLKYAVGRPPPQGSGQPQGAYPSGHTLAAVVFLSTAVQISSRGWIRRVLLAGVAVVTALVGTGLVYDRYHWLSDVIGSLFLAPLLFYWVSLTPPYRACRRLLAGAGTRFLLASTVDDQATGDEISRSPVAAQKR